MDHVNEQKTLSSSLLLNLRDSVAPWLYGMNRIKNVLSAPAIPAAQIPHLHLLLMDNQFNKLYGFCHLAFDTYNAAKGSVKYVLAQLYRLILFTCAKYKSGRQPEAQNCLKRALSIALPDKIFLPFAEQPCMETF